MEILQYLRRRPDATAFMLLLPLLAALLTYLMLQRQAPQFVGEARVIVPEQAATSASGVGLYIADFSVLVESQETVDAVTAATGVAVDDFRDGLEVSREGQSSLFTVLYTTTDSDSAAPVLRTAIATTMGRMAPTGEAERRLESARTAHTDAQNQLRAFQDSIGLLFPDRAYNDLSSQIQSLQGSPNPLDQALRVQLLQRRDALVGQVRTYSELVDRVEQAAAELRETEQAAAESTGAAADVREGLAIQRITITPAPSRHGLQAVGIGAALGLLGAIILTVGPDLLRGARRPKTAPTTSGAAPGPERREPAIRAAEPPARPLPTPQESGSRSA